MFIADDATETRCALARNLDFHMVKNTLKEMSKR
jgi:hypothetical protein